MRRIVSKEEEDKKRRRNQFLVGGVLIAVMLFSTLGYAFNSQDDSSSGTQGVNYNGYNFVEQGGLWVLQVGSAQFAFRYNPNQIERVSSEVDSLSSYSAKPLYLQSESIEAEQEILRNTQGIILRSQYACLNNESCAGDYPIKTCQDNFIIIEKSETGEILQQDKCVFIRGKEEELVKLTDEFLFKMMGIA
jgi:hypothetical protein